MWAKTYAQVCSVSLWTSEGFEPIPVWVWQQVDARETTLVWDIDGDGMPEVLADDYRNPWKIYVLDWETWITESVIETGRDLTQNNSANWIADTDRDWYGEIYFVDEVRKLVRRDFDWLNRSETRVSPGIVWGTSNNHDRYTPHFTDFDGDGVPELYMWPEIFHVSDGTKIASTTVSWYYPGDLWLIWIMMVMLILYIDLVFDEMPILLYGTARQVK